MKLLLDECVPNDLKQDLVGHDVMSVVEAGYRGLKNGELLRAAAGHHDVLITVDRNLPYQQNIRGLAIGCDPRGWRYYLRAVETTRPPTS
jgi:predicted nuclease of predicted toxin-antitoxin system